MFKKFTIAMTLGFLLVFGLPTAVFAQNDPPPGWDWGRRNPVLSQVADLLGMQVTELRAELDSGKTILEIAGGKGLTLDDLVTKISEAMQERMRSAVDNGRLTQSEADERNNSMEECLNAFLKGEDIQCAAHFKSHNFPFVMGRSARSSQNMLDNMAERLNMAVEDLKAALEGGKTIPEIAGSQGVTQEELQAEQQAALVDRINQAVESGNLTQAEADEITAWIKDRPQGNTWFDRMGMFGNGRHLRPRNRLW